MCVCVCVCVCVYVCAYLYVCIVSVCMCDIVFMPPCCNKTGYMCHILMLSVNV